MRKRQKTKKWLANHRSDPYVKLAQKAGYRSRACFKLLEIIEKYPICQTGKSILELGSAPGGWTQVLQQSCPKSQIVAVDLLSMDALPGVFFKQGDCRDPEVYKWLKEQGPYQFICSDMSPNKTGIAVVDQARAVDLWEMCLMIAQDMCLPGGDMLLKVFHGKGFDEFVKTIRPFFIKVQLIKPKASRSRSNELYLMGKGFTLNRSKMKAGEFRE